MRRIEIVMQRLNQTFSAIPDAPVALMLRVFPALVFWQSGQTKVEGFAIKDSTITGQNDNGETQQYTVDYTSLGVGLRTSAPIGPGEVYAQLALGAVFPFETERVQHMTNNESRTTTIGYNSGLGARGELGYHYQLNHRVYLLGGVRVQAFATDNVGRERVRVDQPSGNVDRETYSTDPNAPNTSRAEALSVQDLRLRIGVGVRF